MIKTGFVIKNLCKKFKIEDDEHIVFSDISLEIPGDKITVIYYFSKYKFTYYT